MPATGRVQRERVAVVTQPKGTSKQGPTDRAHAGEQHEADAEYTEASNGPSEQPRMDTLPEPMLSDAEMLQHTHTARQGHRGVQSTWQKLKLFYPGHTIPHAFVEWIRNCPVCQKFRHERGDNYYQPKVQSIPADHLHHSIGIDLAQLEDSLGNSICGNLVRKSSTAPQPIFPRLSVCLTNHVQLAGEPKARSEMQYLSHKMPEKICVGNAKRLLRHPQCVYSAS